jgi:hypothetical protein
MYSHLEALPNDAAFIIGFGRSCRGNNSNGYCRPDTFSVQWNAFHPTIWSVTGLVLAISKLRPHGVLDLLPEKDDDEGAGWIAWRVYKHSAQSLNQIALMLVFHLGISSPKLRCHVCEGCDGTEVRYSHKIGNTMPATQADKHGNLCSRTIVSTRFQVTALWQVARPILLPAVFCQHRRCDLAKVTHPLERQEAPMLRHV